jgi:hypothetical protein
MLNLVWDWVAKCYFNVNRIMLCLFGQYFLVCWSLNFQILCSRLLI